MLQRVKGLQAADRFNARTDCDEDLVRAGVIDPAKVVRAALQHAAIAQIPGAATG